MLGLVSAQQLVEPDPHGVMEAIVGLPSSEIASAHLFVVQGTLLLADHQLINPHPATDLGSVSVMYREPVSWDSVQSIVLHEGDPAASPTGAEVHVSLSTEAMSLKLTSGPNENALLVGVAYEHRWQSGPIDDRYNFFIPFYLVEDDEEAMQRIVIIIDPRFANPPPPTENDPPCPEPSPACMDQCYGDYLRAIALADEEYHQARDYCFDFWRVIAFAGSGCGAGAALCALVPTPPSTIVCCAIGGASVTSARIYECLREAAIARSIAAIRADSDFRACRRACCPAGY